PGRCGCRFSPVPGHVRISSRGTSLNTDVGRNKAANDLRAGGGRLAGTKAAVDASDAFAVQGQHLVKATQLHALDIGPLIGQPFDNALVQTDLVVDLAAD